VGAPDSSSRSDSSADAPADTGGPDEASTYEKWLVRILLGLAFGLAFGIEGMTLIRSFLIDQEEPATEQTERTRPVLREGTVLVPSVGPPLRARRLQVRATNQEWTFLLSARPDSLGEQAYTISFDRLTLSNGSALTTAPRHTWPAADTSSFTASWTLPVGQRPTAITVTATTQVAPDSTVSTTRTMDIGHVPVQMQ
jgi:hypothetical protein